MKARGVGIGWRHPHYAELLESRPPLGFLEVHSENFFGSGGAALALLREARRHYDISLHGVGLALGSACGIDEWHLEQLAALVAAIEPVRVSDHASFARAPSGGRIVHAADLLPVPFNDEALAVMAANIQRVQERLRRPILVENLSAYIELPGSDRSEADFLAELARRTGCEILLDVNNIYVNALNKGAPEPAQACLKWIDAMPRHAVGEIHVAGHSAAPDIVIDDHSCRVCEDVWALHAHAVERFGPVPTLVEWDTDLPPLSVLLEEASKATAMEGMPA